MSFYSFTEEQLRNVVCKPLFQEILKFYFDNVFVLDSETFQGDKEILENCRLLNKENQLPLASPTQIRGNYEILRHYSLPYLSQCIFQSGEMYDMNNETTTMSDIDTRNQVLKKITSKYCIEYWALLHQCVDNVIFIIYPICKLLWSEVQFYLIEMPEHCILVNEIMFDMITNISKECNGNKDIYGKEMKILDNNENVNDSENKDDIENANKKPNRALFQIRIKELLNKYPKFDTALNTPLIFDFISPSINYNREWMFEGHFKLITVKECSIIDYFIAMYAYSKFPENEMRKLFDRLSRI